MNVVDLSVLMSPDDHPHGMDNISFDALFTRDVDVVFAFHGYRWLIHSMVHGRANEARFHVRGFNDRGHDDHAVRYGGAQQDEPLPSGD